MIIFLLIFISLGYIYVKMPVFGFGFSDWSFFCLLWGVGLIFLAVQAIFRNNAGRFTGSLVSWMLYKIFGNRINIPGSVDVRADITDKKYQRMARIGRWLIVIAVINSFVLPLVLSNPLMFSKRYHDLLGPVQESVFGVDVEPLNLSQIRIIDEETAARLADKKIGEIPALGSETRMGKLVLQKVKEKLYYVAPLEHRGFFQWLNYWSTGSHGYIMVSATDPSDVRLVQDIDGKPVRIKYQFGSFLLDYLPRWVYAHGYVTKGLTDFTFQLDEHMQPYWVVTIYDKTIGYSGDNAVGVVTVNAQNGEITRYNLDNMPEWVSRVQPSGFIYEQIADWGKYIYGYWNSVFAKTGTIKPSSNRMHLIYGSDNEVYWYVGMTSSGSDDSTVGFVLVNSRDKQAKFYQVAGATEEAAAKSAEGQVQEKAYRAGYPLLYNVGGIPTYIAPLKDREGLLKQVAFISVENYNIVGVGPDIAMAMRNYMANIAAKGDAIANSREKILDKLAVKGKVSRTAIINRGGDNFVYFMLENDPVLYAVPATLFNKVLLLKAGDEVEMMILQSSNEAKEVVEIKTNY